MATKCLVILLLLAGAGPVRAAETAAASKPKKKGPSAPDWNEQAADRVPLFDGKSLQGWQITDFAGHGHVTVEPAFRAGTNAPGPVILLDMGAILTGISWTNPAPKGEYELSLEAMKVDGSDFFCALTFPAAGEHCSLVVGGWGGGVVGISSVDGMDASENETTKFISFDKNRWYLIRLRVTKDKIEAWIDQDQVVNLVTTDRRISMRAGEIELAAPLGISNYQTKAAIRNIRLRKL
ncbi:MAG: DUF1080 domain-containing protein [Verrucomicrobiota bacterium]